MALAGASVEAMQAMHAEVERRANKKARRIEILARNTPPMCQDDVQAIGWDSARVRRGQD